MKKLKGKNSKLKEITENLSSNPRKSALFVNFCTFLCKNQKIKKIEQFSKLKAITRKVGTFRNPKGVRSVQTKSLT